MALPKTLITAPTRQPLRHGLFSVLPALGEHAGGRWYGSGVEFMALTCAPAGAFPGQDCDPATPEAVITTEDKNTPTFGEGSSFGVYGWFECGPASLDVAQDEAVAHLLLREEARVEHTFWTGDQGNTPALVKSGATPVGGSDLKEAVALLEGWAGSVLGYTGVIHTSRAQAMRMIAAGVAAVTDGVLLTKLGTPVVAGSGYPDDGQIFMTGGLIGIRSEVELLGTDPLSGFKRETNDLVAYAYRTYSLAMDTCGVAVAKVSPPTV